MSAGLFRLVHANSAQRRHPVLSALLYGYCPAAARWWRSGAEPIPVFDACWAVIEQIDAGRTLKEALAHWGLAELTPFARRYVARVEAYRGQEQHRHVHAPEAMPTFAVDALPLSYRHRLANAFGQMDGWENFFPFLRVWAFVLPDWLRAMQLPADTRVALHWRSLPVMAEAAVRIPFWRFFSGDRSAWGILSAEIGAPPDFLTAFIAGGLEAEAGAVFRLGSDGRVLRYRSGWMRADLLHVLNRLAEVAVSGPYPPNGALARPVKCMGCGFRSLCWAAGSSRSDSPTPLALNF